MKQTAIEQHINWLKGCIELLEEQAPIMEKTMMLCLKDAESRLDAEKKQLEELKDFDTWKEWKNKSF